MRIFILTTLLLIPYGPITVPVGLNNFGDSITVGTGVPLVAQAYPYLMSDTFDASTFLGTQNNYAVSGAEGADVVFQTYSNVSNTGSVPTATILIGTNDANYTGTGSNKEAIYTSSLEASASWLAIPQSYKVLGQDTACVKAGTWVSDTSIATGIAEQSSTNGSTLTCTATVGASGIAYVVYRAIDSNGGTLSVTIDGNSPLSSPTLTATGPGGQCICTQNGHTTTLFLARYTGLSSGSHVFLFTVTSATGSSNVNSIFWIGTPFTFDTTTASVFIGGVIYQQGDTDSAATALYNTDALGAASVLAGDGLPVVAVNVRGWVNSTSDMSAGAAISPSIPLTTCIASTLPGLHPNACGMYHITEAFEHYFNLGTGSLNGPGLKISGSTIQ